MFNISSYNFNRYNFGVKCLLGLAHLYSDEIEVANSYLKQVLDLKFLNLEYKRYYSDFAIKHIRSHGEFRLSKFCLALVSFHVKQNEKAGKYLLESLEFEKKHSEISYIYDILFRVLHRSGRFNLLKDFVEKAKQETLKNTELDITINLYEGIVSFHENKFENAKFFFEKLIKSPAKNLLVQFYNEVAIKRSSNFVVVAESLVTFQDLVEKLDQIESSKCSFINVEDQDYDQPISKTELLFHLAECYFMIDDRKNFYEALKKIEINSIENTFIATFSIDDYYYYKGSMEFKDENYELSLETLTNIKNATLNINESNPLIDRYKVDYYKAICLFKLKNPLNAYDLIKNKCNIDKILNVSKEDFYTLKLNVLFDIILLMRKKDDQEELSFYLQEFKNFNEEVENRQDQLDKSFLVRNYYHSIIVEFEIKRNYENCLNLSKKAKELFENELLFLYFIALNEFKLATKTKEISFTLLSECKNNFEKYVEKNTEKTNRRLLNSFFILGYINQLEAEKGRSEEINLKAIEYFKKVFLKNNFSEKYTEDLVESNEYTEISLKFHNAISLFKIKHNSQSKHEFEALKKTLEEQRKLKIKNKTSYEFVHYFDNDSVYHGDH